MKTKTINVGGISCGSEPLFLIAGPCVIEEESLMMETAEQLVRICEKMKLPLIFKSSFQKDNRSSVDFYMGPGLEKGLRLLEKIKQTFNVPVVSDLHYPEQVKPAADVLDILQIPAYLCMQTALVVEAAKTGKVINLKHGQFLAPENMIKPVEKVLSTGNDQILLTERGYTFGYNDLVVDPRSIFQMKETGFPVIFDVTHAIRKYGIPSADPAGGARQYLPVLGRAGVAAGIDGLFIEVHPCPEKALCDAASQLNINQLESFIQPLIEIHDIEVKYRN